MDEEEVPELPPLLSSESFGGGKSREKEKKKKKASKTNKTKKKTKDKEKKGKLVEKQEQVEDEEIPPLPHGYIPRFAGFRKSSSATGTDLLPDGADDSDPDKDDAAPDLPDFPSSSFVHVKLGKGEEPPDLPDFPSTTGFVHLAKEREDTELPLPPTGAVEGEEAWGKDGGKDPPLPPPLPFSGRKPSLSLSPRFVSLDGADPVPSIDSPANRRLHQEKEVVPFADNDEEVPFADKRKGNQEESGSLSSPSSLSSSLRSPISSLSNTYEDFVKDNPSGPEFGRGLHLKYFVVQLVETVVIKHLKTVRISRAFYRLKNHIPQPKQLHEEGKDAEVREEKGEKEEGERKVGRPRAVSDMPIGREMAKLQEKVRQQESELRRVKRLMLVQFIFLKWKLWHTQRVQERMVLDMEKERMNIAQRIKKARTRLEGINHDRDETY